MRKGGDRKGKMRAAGDEPGCPGGRAWSKQPAITAGPVMSNRMYGESGDD